MLTNKNAFIRYKYLKKIDKVPCLFCGMVMEN